MHLLRVAFALLLPLGAALRAEPEFVGVLATARETKVVFRDPAAGLDSGWVGVGETVQGYTVVEYRAADDVLVLRQGNRLLELPLARAKIQGRKADIVSDVKIGLASASGIPCDLLLGVPRVLPLPDGRRLTLEARKEPDGRMTYRAGLEKITGRTIVRGLELPVIGLHQVTHTVSQGEPAILEVAPDISVSFRL